MRKNRLTRSTTAQSTVEYMVLVAAVVSFLVVFFQKGGEFESGLNDTYNDRTHDMTNISKRLSTAYP